MPADIRSVKNAGNDATATAHAGAAVALEGCRIWRPPFSGAPVEIVSADARPRAFPMRVTETLGICLKVGAAHGVRADGRSMAYPADSICIRPPGCVWTSEAAPVAFLSIDVGGDWLPAEGVRGVMTFAPRDDLPDVGAIVRRVSQASSALESDVALAELVTAAIGIVTPRAPALRDEGAGRRGVMRARDYLIASVASVASVGDHPLDHPIEQNPTLDALARHASMNKFVLVRAFRRMFGTTPHAYLMAIRLERARVLLAGGMRSIDVSAATGFADQAHFSRWFKRKYGMTPAAYAGRTR